MTEKELQKLKRIDLLEILVEQGKEIERLRKENKRLEELLKKRTISINEAGTIAEASLRLNGVFEAAQAAATQYLENIQELRNRQEAICAQMERETAEKCEAMLAEAKRGADAHWEEIAQRLELFYDAHHGLRELLEMIGDAKLSR